MTLPVSKKSLDLLANEFLKKEFKSSDKPTIYAMAGIPAAGKSTFVANRQATGVFPTQAYILNPDLIMHALPEYKQSCSAAGNKVAFKRWELPCRTVAYDFFNQAKSRNLDIIKDMGNARLENIEKIKALKESGYQVKVFFVYLEPNIAIERVKFRDRHTADEMIFERAASLKELLPELIKIADEFHAYDNSGSLYEFTEITTQQLSDLVLSTY